MSRRRTSAALFLLLLLLACAAKTRQAPASKTPRSRDLDGVDELIAAHNLRAHSFSHLLSFVHNASVHLDESAMYAIVADWLKHNGQAASTSTTTTTAAKPSRTRARPAHAATTSNSVIVSASASDIRVWSVDTGQLVVTLHTGAGGAGQHINTLRLVGPDHLVSGGADGQLVLWQLSSATRLLTIDTRQHGVFALELVGKRRVACGFELNSTIDVWDVESGTCVSRLTGHTSGVVCLKRAGVDLLASGSSDHTVRVWNVTSSACVWTMRGHTALVSTLEHVSLFRVASASWDASIRTWNTRNGRCIRVLLGHTARVNGLLRVDAGRLASAAQDATIRLWNVDNGECTRVIHFEHTSLNVLHMLVTTTADSNAPPPPSSSSSRSAAGHLVAGGEDGVVYVWSLATADEDEEEDPTTSTVEQRLVGHDGPIRALQSLATYRYVPTPAPSTTSTTSTTTPYVEPDLVAIGTQDGSVCVLDMAVKSSRRACDVVQNVSSSEVVALKLINGGGGGGHLLVSVWRDGRVKAWNDAGGTMVHSSKLGAVLHSLEIVWATDGSGRLRLAVGTETGSVNLVDVPRGQHEKAAGWREMRGHVVWVQAVRMLDAEVLASGGGDGSIRLWNVTSGECLSTWQTAHSRAVSSLEALDDGLFASGSHDNSIRIWRWSMRERSGDDDNRMVRQLVGHKDWVTCLQRVAEDRLASASEDRTVRVWSVASAECVHTLVGHRHWVRALAMSFDASGRRTPRLLSGSSDGALKVWSVLDGSCLNTFNATTTGITTIVAIPSHRAEQ